MRGPQTSLPAQCALLRIKKLLLALPPSLPQHNPQSPNNNNQKITITELVIKFGNPAAKDSSLGCATMFRLETLKNGRVVMTENVQNKNPLAETVELTRLANEGDKIQYRITAINGATDMKRESEVATTQEVTAKRGYQAFSTGRKMM